MKSWEDLVATIALETPDPSLSLRRLRAFLSSSGSPEAFRHLLRDDPVTLKALLTIMSASGYAHRLLCLFPEYLELLQNRPAFVRPKRLSAFLTELDMALAPFQTPSAKWDAMRRFRHRETFRVLAADLLGFWDLKRVVMSLSDLAEGVIRVAKDLACDDGDCRLLIVAFGKLGARELNYSSDIDLVFFYEGEEQTALRWARKIVGGLTTPTGYGRLYRVDLRLRPYGASGPMSLSLEGAFAYYESWSEPGDRLALLKARPIAGDPDLADRFERFRKDFLFGRPLEPGELAWLLHLKERSETALGVDPLSEMPSVKHGVGGIRDVEMSVQLLQLAFGYRFTDLSVRDTLTALEALCHHGLLGEGEAKALRSGYEFLRRLEHLLQIAEDLPMHTLPDDPKELRRLGRCFGLADEKAFLSEFQGHIKTVRRIYETVTEELKRALGVSVATTFSLKLVTGLEADEGLLTAKGFRHPEQARQRLHRLVHGEEASLLPWRERVGVMRILPLVLEALSRTPDPDTALVRLENLLSSLGPRRLFLESLATNPLSLRAFTLIACLSEPLCHLIARSPELLEGLFGAPEVFVPTHPAIPEVIATEARDEKTFMQTLRRTKDRIVLYWGIRHLCRLTDGATVGKALARLGDILVTAAILWCKAPLCALALGSWGSESLPFGADLDVAFVHEGLTEEAERNVCTVQNLLGSPTREGIAFRLDLRLRPTGKEGALSTDVPGWEAFATERFSVWMALAWLRMRVVGGRKDLGERVCQAVHQRLYGKGLSGEEWSEWDHLIGRIRNAHHPPKGAFDIKHSPKGLWDTEIRVAQAQLKWGWICKELQTNSVQKALKALAKREERWRPLERNYRWLRELRLWLSWIKPESPTRFVPGDEAEKSLAWLDTNPDPIRQSQLIPVEEAVERFRGKWRTLATPD